MFIPVPIRLHDGRDFHAIPLANGILVVLNVLLFFFGGHFAVGPGTGILSVVTYAFAHANVFHLAGNMFALLVFGTAVNRRLGNGWYLVLYMGTVLCLGVGARLMSSQLIYGSSGAIFAVIATALMLFPSAILEIGYFALFPITLIAGVLSAPKHWVFWFIRVDTFKMRAMWGLLLVPLLELWGLYWSGWS